MKRLILLIVISVFVMFLTGCAKPCFYQAGKNIEQSEHDLLQCIQEANNYSKISKNALLSSIAAGIQQKYQPAELTCLCMQAKGYQYLDANKLPQNRERIMVIAPFRKYWAVDGADAASEDRKILSEQKPQENNPDTHLRRSIRYQARKDTSGKLMKDASGNYIFAPVYEDVRHEIASLEQTGGK
ncbi:hypothetical protein ACFL3Q_15285 [Planctomycetota bacterium]